MTNVTAAIITNDQREILIARRKPGKALAGYWEFPGGKIEEGESPEESLVRELKEEMNLQVQVQEFLGESVYHYEHLSIRLMAYRTTIVEGSISLSDHDAVEWASMEALQSEYPMAPADMPLLNCIVF